MHFVKLHLCAVLLRRQFTRRNIDPTRRKTNVIHSAFILFARDSELIRKKCRELPETPQLLRNSLVSPWNNTLNPYTKKYCCTIEAICLFRSFLPIHDVVQPRCLVAHPFVSSICSSFQEGVCQTVLPSDHVTKPRLFPLFHNC